MARTLNRALLLNLAHSLDNTPHGGRVRLVDAWAEKAGCSRMELYRELRSVGWCSGRKRRKDAGTTGVSLENAQDAAGLMLMGTRKKGKRAKTLKGAVELLHGNGKGDKMIKETGEFVMHSPQAVSRAMRLYRCHPDQLAKGEPARCMKSLHPNHVWEMDASICVLFYLQNGALGVMDEKKFYKNKPHNFARISDSRVWRYIVLDHCSGAFFLWYVMGAESALNATESFMRAMCPRGAGDVLHGAPLVLYTDPGIRYALLDTLCEALGVRRITHATGNARATGAVEACQNIVETRFESRMAFQNYTSLEAIQTAADMWRLHLHAHVKHTRTGRFRNVVWRCITPEQLRVPASLETLRELAVSEAATRVVTAQLTISYASRAGKAAGGGKTYDVSRIPGIMKDDVLTVRVNPWRVPAIDVTHTLPNGETYTCTVEPQEFDQWGFAADAPVIGEEFKAHKHSEAGKQLDAIKRRAFGTDTAAEADAARKAGARPYAELDHMADVRRPVPSYFPRQGTRLEVQAGAPPMQPMTHVKAAKLLSERCGSVWAGDPVKCMAWLRQRFPDGVPPEEIDGIAADLKRGEGAFAAPLHDVLHRVQDMRMQA